MNSSTSDTSHVWLAFIVLFVAMAPRCFTYEWNPKCLPKCSCSNTFNEQYRTVMKTVNCKNKGFKVVPKGKTLPEDTEVLLYSGNKIINLTSLPDITSLHLLDLSLNNISFLSSHWLFEHQFKLKHLNLSHNNITQLQHGSFSGLKYLNVLDLSFNHINYIEIHAFGGLNHLQILNLDGNRLKYIEKDWFFKMPGLSVLTLSDNQLTSIEEDVFLSLSELTKLIVNKNSIKSVESGAFSYLVRLDVLDLSDNQFTSIPLKELLQLVNLRTFRFNGNFLPKLGASSLRTLNVSEISLSYSSTVKVIDKYAFIDLPNLKTLELHDNQMLLFIDPEAFYNLPELRYLYMHNNQLMAISSKIAKNLPQLTEIHLYQNPIHCDCNSYWIKSILESNITNTTKKIEFVHSGNIVCDDPIDKYKIPLEQIPIDTLRKTCPPTALPLFKDKYNISIGETLYLECHAIGVPQPAVHWLLPGEKQLDDNITKFNDHIQLRSNSTLVINNLVEEDVGTYACIAINTKGYDISSTAVKVHFFDIRIRPNNIKPHFITLSWSGSDDLLLHKTFQIQYRRVKGSDSYDSKVLHLRPYMHRYTIKNLKAFTTYEFCVFLTNGAFRHKLHCINVQTKHPRPRDPGITRLIDIKIVIGLCVGVAVSIFIVCSYLVFRTFRKRKDYEQPKVKTRLLQPDDRQSFQMDNLYAGSTGQLCSSQTSLISHRE